VTRRALPAGRIAGLGATRQFHHGLLAAAAALVALSLPAADVAAQAPASRILVMPFENAARENRIFWLSEASAVLLADNLNALGASAITREERKEAFQRLQVPPTATLTDATVIRIGQLVGASQVVVGTLRLDGDTLVVQARTIALEAARVVANVTERGALPRLYAIFESVARRIAPASPRSSDEIGRGLPPLAAFENYIKGILAETPATAVSYLNAALKLHPPFARARLALWDVYAEQDDHQRALAAVDPVESDSPYHRRARFRTGLSQIHLQKHDDAFATFKALADARPTAPVLNNLGVVQLRRGGTPQAGVATYYFTQAAEADPTESDYFFNLGYAYWAERDTQAAIYWLREALRRDPTDGDAHFVLGAALAAAGNTSEANREKELARRLSSTYEEWEKRPGPDQVPRDLERLRTDVELPQVRVEDALATSGQRDQRELARFQLDRARRLYEQENDRDALAELSRALYLAPYDADAHLLVGRIHLRGRRTAEAMDALKISLWSAETAEAHVVLAEAYLEARDPASARTEAERALAIDPNSSDAKRVLELASAAGR
jgi:tetratricopeptide (TPR) repeat protein